MSVHSLYGSVFKMISFSTVNTSLYSTNNWHRSAFLMVSICFTFVVSLFKHQFNIQYSKHITMTNNSILSFTKNNVTKENIYICWHNIFPNISTRANDIKVVKHYWSIKQMNIIILLTGVAMGGKSTSRYALTGDLFREDRLSTMRVQFGSRLGHEMPFLIITRVTETARDFWVCEEDLQLHSCCL